MNLEAPRYVNAGPMLLAGLSERYKCNAPNDIPALWGRFGPHIGNVPGQVGRVGFGVCFDMNPESFQYLACVEVSGASGLPDGLTTLQLPAHRFAVFQHKEHVSKMVETAGTIWTKWLPESGEQLTEPCFMLERYGEGFEPTVGMGDI